MRLVVFGSRGDGQAKVCLYLARSLGHAVVGWLDDVEPQGDDVLDLPVLGGREWLSEATSRGVEGVVLGFGQGRGRRELLGPVRAAGLELPTLVHPSASVDPSARIAAGATVLRAAVVGDDVEVGEAALVNAGAILTHDNRLQAGATIGPGAVLAARARVQRDAELGAGAILLPDADVGEGAMVGAGAVVTSVVAAGTTVVGIPARPLA